MIISFEGIDGCGKSTQERILAEWLTGQGRQVRRVREPGGTSISEQIRSILLDPASEIDPFAEMLLFSAARAQLCRTRIQGWKAAGDIVLCDRFFDSTIAYQGGGRGVADPQWLESFQLAVADGLVPDLTFYFRISPEEARTRLSGNEDDRMELAGPEFFHRVVNTYDELAARHGARYRTLDATRSIADLAEQVRSEVASLLRLDRNTQSV